MIKPTEKIWHNGRFINWDDAKIHVLSHVTSYGSSVFEGLRCYETESGPALFRAREHMRRLRDSAKIYRMDLTYSVEELVEASIELIRVNGLRSCYVRPLVLRGYGGVGVLATKDNPLETYLAAWEWGKYLGEEALSQGVDVCISSWTRIAPNTLPALANGRCQLHELAADPHGSRHQRLRGRDRARRRRLHQRKARVRTSSWCATARSPPRRSAPASCPASPATASSSSPAHWASK